MSGAKPVRAKPKSKPGAKRKAAAKPRGNAAGRSPAGIELDARLAPALGHKFRKPDLLLRALTHPSFAHEESPSDHRAAAPNHYESIEFLGDAILGALVAEEIFRLFPERDEGEMSRLRASLVNARALGDKAAALGLGPCIRLGRGERASGGELKRSILADCFESVLGAIYLDAGMRATRAFIRRHLGEEIRAAHPQRPQTGDFKTRLQEIVQANGGPPPVYRLLTEAGPPHQRVFEVVVELPSGRGWTAIGASKKQAEQAAAERAIAGLESPQDAEPERI